MERKFTNCKLLTVFVIAFFILNSNAFSQAFAPLGSGANGYAIYSVAEFNGELVAAGDFTYINGMIANGIAHWNGYAWAPIGEGFKGGPVRSMAVYNGELYAAGSFINAGQTIVNRIAKWDGTAWVPLGIGANGDIEVLTVYEDELYLGGSFTSVGGVEASGIARWNGSAWSSVGTGTNGRVNAMITHGGKLYVGGDFSSIGKIPVSMIASWNGSNWNSVGGGVSNGSAVYSFEKMDGDLIIGGMFTNIGGTPVNNIARWDGYSYSSLADGLAGGSVHVLKVHLGDLYIGGEFTGAIGGSSVSSITKWDGGAFTPLNSGCNSNVLALCTYDKTLVAGGSFIIAGGIAVNRITLWGKRPDEPYLQSPANASAITILTPTFEWTSIENAADYRIQVSTDVNFSTTVIDEGRLIENRYQAPDGLLNPETTYFWRVNARNAMGESRFSNIFYFSSIISGIENISGQVPDKYTLYGNYPNPFNPSTKIKFDIPAAGFNSNTKLVVYDALGKEVVKLFDSKLQPGTYEFEFNASNLTSGIYFYSLITEKFIDTQKMVLLK